MRLNDDSIMILLDVRDGELHGFDREQNSLPIQSLQLFFTNKQAIDLMEELASALDIHFTYPDGTQNITDSDMITFVHEQNESLDNP